MVKYEQLTVAELKKTVAYTKIPSFEKKSIAKKDRLIELLKKYEKVKTSSGRKSPRKASRSRKRSPRRKSPRKASRSRKRSPRRKSPRKASRSRKRSPRRKSPRKASRSRKRSPRRKSPRKASRSRKRSPRRKEKTIKELREECREQGLVYDTVTKKCRESKKKSTSKRSSPQQSMGDKKPKTKRTGDCIERSNLPLAEHQIKVARYLENHKGIIAVHGIGTGKTLTAVATSQCFLDKFPNSKVIVISPAALLANFKKGMEEYGLETNHSKYEFYSFDAFAKRKNIPAYCKDNLLIIDEAHNLRTVIKGQKGKKAAQTISCARTAKRILLLTATPFVNNDIDLNNLLALAKGKEPYTKSEWIRLMNDNFAKSQYFRCMFSVYFREQGDKNYPRRIDKEIEFEMDFDYLQKYIDIEDENEDKLAGMDIKNPFAFLSGLRVGLLKIENSAKIDYVVKEASKKVNEGRKIVIYSNFVGAGIKNVASKLEAIGIKFYEFTGKTSAILRKKYVDDYNAGKVKVLLITKAASEGLDLKETNAIFILDPPWNEAGLEQAIGRAIRYKSHINLPENDRYVEVYTLYNVKPKWYTSQTATLPSADTIIKTIIDFKREATKETIKYLNKYSIESNNC
jgi:SNF2 family DNA or RNA helicase